MASKRFRVGIDRSSRGELRRKLAKAKAWQRRRIQAVLAAAGGKLGFRGVMRDQGVSAGALRCWLDKFRRGGVEELLSRSAPPGAKARVHDPKLLKELAARIRDGRLRTTQQVSHWLQHARRIRLKPKSVYPLMRKMGVRFFYPRGGEEAVPEPAGTAAKIKPLGSGLPAQPKRGRPRLEICLQQSDRSYLVKLTAESWRAYCDARRRCIGGMMSRRARRLGSVYTRLAVVQSKVVKKMTIKEIADDVNCAETSVHRWLAWFRALGSNRLAIDAMRRGRPGELAQNSGMTRRRRRK